jgi:hypothetical protein
MMTVIRFEYTPCSRLAEIGAAALAPSSVMKRDAVPPYVDTRDFLAFERPLGPMQVSGVVSCVAGVTWCVCVEGGGGVTCKTWHPRMTPPPRNPSVEPFFFG